jgi:hypothetical protein
MSTQVPTAFVQQFSANLIHLAQQKGSRLMPTVMVKEVVGKYAHFDRLGKTAARKRTSRHGDTPIIDTPHSRRRAVLEDYDWSELVDSQDELRMLIDPKSAYAEAGAWALGRSMDDAIIDAAVGSSQSIDSSDSSSNTAFDPSMIVDEDFGTANTNLTFEKLNEAKRLLRGKEIDPDEELFCVVNADALHSLLTESEIQSIDTNTVRALVQGDLNTFMGFKFVHSERISTSSEGFYQVLCYAKSAIGVALGENIKVRLDERPDKCYATQVYACMSMGVVRIEEEKIAIIECVQ